MRVILRREHESFGRRLTDCQSLREVDEHDVAGIGLLMAVAREPSRRAVDLQGYRKSILGAARGTKNKRNRRISTRTQHVARRGEDIDLAAELGDLPRSRANLEHLAERAAPLGEQFRRGAIFRLQVQSTQTEWRLHASPCDLFNDAASGRKMNAARRSNSRWTRATMTRWRHAVVGRSAHLIVEFIACRCLQVGCAPGAERGSAS